MAAAAAGGSAADHDLMAEVEAEPPFARPTDEGVDAAAFGKFDEHRLAEPGNDVAFDHRAARGDVEHRDLVTGAAEPDGGAVDEAFVSLFAAPLDRARSCCRPD